jgi:hypothetical protein
MAKKWVNDVATINKSKTGNLYIQINEDFSVKKGDRLVLKSKKEEILASAEKGAITVERAEELIEKLHFIKYVIHQPPREEN